MRRREFVRGLMALGVTAAVADQLAFVEGVGRVWSGADFVTLKMGPGDEYYGGSFQIGEPRLLNLDRYATGDIATIDGTRYRVLGVNPKARDDGETKEGPWLWVDRAYERTPSASPPPADYRLRDRMAGEWCHSMGVGRA